MPNSTSPDCHPATDDNTVGLLAAWGRFPMVVAESLKRDGYRVCCLGVKGHADGNLARVCDEFDWVGLAKLGWASRWFASHGVQRAMMAGKIHKVNFFQPMAIWHLMPDWTTLKAFYPHFVARTSDRKDDTLLLAVVDTFARHGIEFLPATDYAPQLLIDEGVVAGRELTKAEYADVEFGWHLAKQMGQLDVGQSVCVKGQAVLAVEAVEGTDHCIARAGELCRQGGFTVVKTAKPQQDMRFDVPTVGQGTLESMARAGARVLAIEARKTILLEASSFRSAAQRLGITVVAIDPEAHSCHADRHAA
ncbi:UDP-2,3-diacylglucosamine diphosphatase LpxI [Aeoliella sp. ICT_H6.2]|uniref:UDP-2,3-diacylglucosamine diphosphatase LpxI n=1 Tax=Aeoliella straminimaris TaxID=2954799 RepID=A0A9X2F5Y5_9BACT|nr:UDP-2,3-diacylglucosamine diphosphatase LpxI [Aeoliella straminimaris]MCO6042810.1 UDP-2,3-diacylglucosamine diphosphatase LpxI [Aeoliella straminimaris]